MRVRLPTRSCDAAQSGAFLHTGDIATVRADGIADAAVIGASDADGQEVPVAFVVRQAGAEGELLDEDAVMDFVAAKVAPFKKLRRVEFIDAVPKSSSGKILRRMLKTAGPAAAAGASQRLVT